MRAIYLGEVLPIPSGTPVDVALDSESLTIAHAGQSLSLPADALRVHVEKRLTFDPGKRRQGTILFGALSMAERRGEPTLQDVAHIETPSGPLILVMENVQAFVDGFTPSRQQTTARAVPTIRGRPVRRVIAFAILVLVALIIALISARPNPH